MLSYRHGFHAGNHADVLKHWVQVLCLQYLKQKEKPFFYIDTHAGGGLYDLTSPYAKKTSEAEQGIQCLWQHAELPEVFEDYMGVVKQFNSHRCKQYPGSPAIAAKLMRQEDKIRLIEMHGTEAVALQKLFAKDRRVKIFEDDGFRQIKALLPPATRRGLVMIDPSYEMKNDYQRVIGVLKESVKRFANGMYLVWYPLINSVAAQRFSEQLEKLPCDTWLDVQLMVSRPPQGHGMYGSGMFVINPPWILKQQLEAGLGFLTTQMGLDESAQGTVRSSE